MTQQTVDTRPAGQNGPQGDEQEQPEQHQPAGSEGAQNGAEGSNSEEESEQTFSAEYVARLRAEAAEQRTKAKRADYLATEVRRLSMREAVRGILADPESLPWSDDFAAEDGMPDQAKIAAAAEALASERPYLARPRGQVGQGEHGNHEQAASLSELLRA